MRRFAIYNESDYGKVSQYKAKGLKNTNEFLHFPLILVTENIDGGYYLYRTDIHGDFGGDTFHDNIEDIDDQLDYEFGVDDIEWRTLESALSGSDLISFVVERYITGRKVLRFFFDPGSGICLWSGNRYTSDLMGYPVDLDQLLLSTKTYKLLFNLMNRFDSCLDLDNPGAGVIWTEEEKSEFHKDSLIALKILREELGDEYVIVDEL